MRLDLFKTFDTEADAQQFVKTSRWRCTITKLITGKWIVLYAVDL